MNNSATAITLTHEPRITQEFQHAFDVLEHTQHNVFLTGKAGTGKSTFLQFI